MGARRGAGPLALRVLALATLALAGACSPEPDEDTVLIGVSWSGEGNDFVAGVELAVDEVNAVGGVLDKRLAILLDEREASPEDGDEAAAARSIASSFATRGVTAAVGHRSSALAVPASNLYQHHGIVFLAPTATRMALTAFDFRYVFRMHPDNEQMGAQIAAYGRFRGHERLAILHDRSDYARELAEAVERGAVDQGLRVTRRTSFFSSVGTTGIRRLAIEMKRFGAFDAIVLITGSRLGAEIYHRLRLQGITQPFVGGEALEAPAFWEAVERWETAETEQKTAVPVVYDPNQENAASFAAKFEKEHERAPDRLGALGYDAVKVLVHAMNAAESTAAGDIADGLHYLMTPCLGATGRFEYAENGDMRQRALFMKLRAGAGRFEYVGPFPDPEEAPEGPELDECASFDTDKDAVLDNVDECPEDSPLEIGAGVYQEGDELGCPVDTDEDGVADYADACPEDPPEVVAKGVGEKGCPKDTDGDGVPDYRDRCPEDGEAELAAGVGGEGCPLDTDGDEVPDYRDTCRYDSPEEIARGTDLRGCPLDSDGDGNPDHWDRCPDDPPETLGAGIDTEGCPLDGDEDGVLDYRDRCRGTPAGIEVDEDGCPLDRDRDGIADYLDRCPENTPEELSAGIDGEGCPLDGDGDGVPDYLDACRETDPALAVEERGCPRVEKAALTLAGDSLIVGRGRIPQAAYRRIDEFLAAHPLELIQRMTVVGHTDDRGGEALNLHLSEQRAAAAGAYLVRQGIAAERIQTRGEGQAHPVAPNDTRDGRRLNRRVEIRLERFVWRQPQGTE